MELLNPLTDLQFAAKSASYSGTAGTTGNWPPGPQGVLVWCTTDAYIQIVSDSTASATVSDTPLPGGTPVPFKIPNTGVPWAVSAVQIGAAGIVYAKPININ